MNNFWLIKKSSKKLLIFFNGWGMDENPFLHLKSSEYDVLMFYNYQNLDAENLKIEEWNNYQEINLVCWSMGVWTANFFREYLGSIKFSIAINGSFFPIHNDFGIPDNIFQLTLDNFSLLNREKFYKKMFSKDEDFQKFLKIQPKREIIDQKKELLKLQYYIKKEPFSDMFNFNQVIIGKYDKIIPAKNQKCFWQQKLTPLIIEAPHYAFFLWNNWENIIEHATFH
ncbi:MAG: pimeloyl-ACP methyl esterase BioG family protein [bacterium]